METIYFKKSYSRDCSIILEELWFEAQTINFEQYFKQINPFGAPNAYFINEGILEIWENEKAIEWNKSQLLNLVNNEKKFISDVIEDYRNAYKILEEAWQNGLATSEEEILFYIDNFKKAVNIFAVMFFLMTNENAPKEQITDLLKLRSSDNLMDGSDNYIRKSILNVYPEMKETETVIKIDEITHKTKNKKLYFERKENWLVIPGQFDFVGSLMDFMKNHQEYIFQNEDEVDLCVKEFKGQIANKGYAKGMIRVLKRKEEIGKVELGDIIVSPMTIPDFMPAMKKASAYVTDEGGITCHAAIIARELNKPCIIGTKIATKVLKDGDVIEVDAEKGIVKILK